MTFENLAGLTMGEILSSPLVSGFEDFAYDAQKVKSGDLYLAIDKSKQSLELAVTNGAYGVLYDEDFEITDKEIAWIKVQNIGMALMRLMRFQGNYKKLRFVFLTTLQSGIMKKITLPNNAKVLPEDLLEAFLTIMKVPDESFIFCDNDLTLQKIAPEHESIFSKRNITVQKNGSLFISSFIHEGEYYQKVPISPFFVPQLCGIISFFKKNEIVLNLNTFEPIEHFDPIFVDAAITPQSFGDTRRAIIVESDNELFKYETTKLFAMQANASNMILICKHINSTSKVDVNFLYKNEKDLKQLRSYNFRYALVLGDKQKILGALSIAENLRYPSLF